MTTLDPVVLLAGADQVAPHAFQGEPALLDVKVNVLSLEPGQFGRDHVVVGRFVNIDRWHPATPPRRKPVQAVLDGEEIADVIPAPERHGIDANTL